MSVKLDEIINILEKIAPSNLAYEWDNVGLQIGSHKQKVSKVLLALDLTPDVVEEAIGQDVDMVITHHPLIFTAQKRIIKEDILGGIIYKLIENNISLYVMHTNLDIANGGTNDVLCDIIKLNNQKPIDPDENGLGLGRIGIIEPTTIKDISKLLKTKLGIEKVRTVYDVNQKVTSVAVCTGSGMGIFNNIIKESPDVFITGDVKFHEAQQAIYNGIGIIDIGHYASENIVMPALKEELEKYFNNIDIIVSKLNQDPFKVI